MEIKHPDLLEKLENASLTKKEALIYLSILELGGAYPSKISHHAGLNRTTAYHLLDKMTLKGLVNKIEKKNKIFYQISRPNKLVDYAKYQKARAEEHITTAEKLLPDIEGLFAVAESRPKVTYYSGIEGVLEVYNDHINVAKPYEMKAWANARELQKFLPTKFFDNYVRVKEKKKVTTRGLIPDTKENREFNSIRYRGIEKKYWPHMKFMKPDSFPLAGEITVYAGNKISIANFEREVLVGVIIEDKALHDAISSIFELSWTSSLIKE